jgi:hypothetical protein
LLTERGMVSILWGTQAWIGLLPVTQTFYRYCGVRLLGGNHR